jgi:LuxR family transcriptional regulator, maltose regulon positive regulatory protein
VSSSSAIAAEFSGSERTVAEYLLAEVLDRQSEQVRRLLLRTSVLERVNGELADLLTGQRRGAGAAGSGGGERVRGIAGPGAVLVPVAARLLADHWPSLYLGGRTATGHALMAGFPAGAPAADAELAAVAAADELAQGSLETAQRYLELAQRGLASVPEGRRGQAQLLLGVIRMKLISQTGN